MSEYISVPSYALVHGENLTVDELALIEPQSIGAHGIHKTHITKGEYVLIIGAGPIGMGVMEHARISDGIVIAMDINEYRLSLCHEKLHVQHIINGARDKIKQRLLEITDGQMPTVVIDATGNQAAINNSFQYLAHGGRYTLIGLQKNNITFSHPEFHKREATLMSSRNATREDFNRVIEQMKRKEADPLAYLTHRVKFSEVGKEFKTWLESNNHVIKVMIEMD
jgi:threonine dehydrogenase-like Zn-dependent dehydrogenase